MTGNRVESPLPSRKRLRALFSCVTDFRPNPYGLYRKQDSTCFLFCSRPIKECSLAMRAFVFLLGLVAACIALAAYTSSLRPHTADVPASERPPETPKPYSDGNGPNDSKNLLSYDQVTQGTLH